MKAYLIMILAGACQVPLAAADPGFTTLTNCLKAINGNGSDYAIVLEPGASTNKGRVLVVTAAGANLVESSGKENLQFTFSPPGQSQKRTTAFHFSAKGPEESGFTLIGGGNKLGESKNLGPTAQPRKALA